MARRVKAVFLFLPYVRDSHFVSQEDIQKVASLSHGYVGADLAAVIKVGGSHAPGWTCDFLARLLLARGGSLWFVGRRLDFQR